MTQMYKVVVEGTGGLPEILDNLFPLEGAVKYCKDKKLTLIKIIPIEEFRLLMVEKHILVSNNRPTQYTPRTMSDITEIIEPLSEREPFKFNSLKNVDWIPKDQHGIAKIPMLKPQSVKLRSRRK